MDSSDDPNDDPEIVRMFTMRDSDEDPESDDEAFISPWRTSLQPSENPYDRAARVQQANEELFSQPIVGSHSETKVTFDLIPQKIMDEGFAHEGGEGESANMEDTNTHLQTRFRRKDTASYIRYPRRFSGPQHNRWTDAYNQHENLTQALLLSRQLNTSEDQQQTSEQTSQKEKPSPEQVLEQSHEQVLRQSTEQVLQQSEEQSSERVLQQSPEYSIEHNPEQVIQQSPEYSIEQSPEQVPQQRPEPVPQQRPEPVPQQRPEPVPQQRPEPVPQQSQPQTPRPTPRSSQQTQQTRRSSSKPPEPRRPPRMSS